MNILKKTLSLFLVFAMLFALAACAEPDATTAPSTTTKPGVSGENGTYTVKLTTAGGMALAGYQVIVYSDAALSDPIDMGSTDKNGVINFSLAKGGEYYIGLDKSVLEGYDVQDSYTFSGTTADITLTSSVVKGQSHTSKIYQLGDVMYDFSFTSTDGEEITLSEVLAEKELVILNYWYTTCSACMSEFPVLDDAYQMNIDGVEVLGLNSYAPDDEVAVSGFEAAYNMPLSFPIGKVENNFNPQSFINPLTGAGCEGYPTSIFIDRYGVICLIEVGSMTSLLEWNSVMAHFTGEDYEQKLVTSADELIDQIEPYYPNEDPADLAATLNTGDIQVEYTFDEDPYAWPFLIGEKDGREVIYASNQQIYESFAIIYANVTMEKGDVLAFDYLCSSEAGYDCLYVIVDEEPIYTISGDKDEWASAYCWIADKPGTYELALCYMKDTDNDVGDDTCYISDLRIVTVDDIDTPSYLPRQAGNLQEDDSYEYVDIYLNENDGYYHVGSVDGPLLLAGLYDYTQFDENGYVFEWGFNGELKLDGHDYYEDLLDFINAASKSSLAGWCTVTEELAELLKIVDQIKGFDDEDDNEWMLLCKYFDAYGTNGEQLADPIAGIKTWSAYTAVEGVGIETNVLPYDGTPLIPRGKFARFTPDKSGVYRITSSTDYNDVLSGWIFDEDTNMLFEYSGDQLTYTDPINVSMIMYMEAGVDYYIDIAPYDVYAVCNIWYDIEFFGESYELFRSCSPGPFTFIGDDYEQVVSRGIQVVINPEDGYYHEDLGTDAQGNQIYGSIVYAYFIGPTVSFNQALATINGVKGIIELGGFDFSKTESDQEILAYLKQNNNDVDATYEYLRTLWGDNYAANLEIYQVDDVLSGIYHGHGPNLEAEMLAYCDLIIESDDELNGCVPVDARLAELLQMIMAKYTFDADGAWQKFCFYYDPLYG